MNVMKTPGVYIVEKNAFPNSIVQVATAVPAFIGYTEFARNVNRSLANVPFRISSMQEFEKYFGGDYSPKFDLLPFKGMTPEELAKRDEAGENITDPMPRIKFKAGKKDWELKQSGEHYALYAAMRHFFLNGGGPCWIVSVGSYNDTITSDALEKGISTLVQEMEPTMVVIPETTRLSRADSIKIQQLMLRHCGGVMKNRFALLDIFGGFREKNDGDPVASFRDKLGTEYLDFGAAYYPWTQASIYGPRNFTYTNITDTTRDKLIELLKASVDQKQPQIAVVNEEIAKVAAPKDGAVATPVNRPVSIDVVTADNNIDPKTVVLADADADSDGKAKTIEKEGTWSVDTESGAISFSAETGLKEGDTSTVTYTATTIDNKPFKEAKITVTIDPKAPLKENIDKTLRIITPLYQEIMTEISDYMNCIPPAAAMAGIYTMVDNSRGVWKAPGNVSLGAVVKPLVNLSNADQEDLNVTPQGKSINAIRSFMGEGTLVWGARTLDGNSLDWRYINVRRTMIMLEESIRLAAKAYVFEPNVSTTWVTIRSMIENFLTGIWKQGGLAGAVPSDAFIVQVGLGETMTPNDILEGILRITVLVAISRPAEFIEITFQQKLQES